MREVCLVAVWALSAWAMPQLHVSSTPTTRPSLPPVPPSSPCPQIRGGMDVAQSGCGSSSPPFAELGDITGSSILAEDRLLSESPRRVAEWSEGSRNRLGRWNQVLRGRLIRRRSDHPSDDDEDNEHSGKQDYNNEDDRRTGQSGESGAKTTDTTTGEPTRTRTAETTASPTDDNTKTTAERTATAESTTAADKTTQPSSNTMSTTMDSSTATTSDVSSSTTGVTTTSKASTTSGRLRIHTATTTSEPPKDKSDGDLQKSSIAAASVFSVLAGAALIFLAVMYYKKARNAWNRRKQDRLSRVTSMYSVVPLVEDDTATKAAMAQTRGSLLSDRESWMFSRSRSSSVTIAIEDTQDSDTAPRVYYKNGETYIPLEQVDTSYQGASLSSGAADRTSMEPRYDPPVSSGQQNANSPPISVVVSPPPSSPTLQTPNVVAPPSAAVAASAYSTRRVSRGRTRQIRGNIAGEVGPALGNRNDNASTSDGVSWLPSIPRSTSPLFNFSERQSQHRRTSLDAEASSVVPHGRKRSIDSVLEQ